MRRSRQRRNRSVYGVRIDDKRSLRARPGLDGGHDVALFGVDEIAVRVLLRLKRLGLAVYLDVERQSSRLAPSDSDVRAIRNRSLLNAAGRLRRGGAGEWPSSPISGLRVAPSPTINSLLKLMVIKI